NILQMRLFFLAVVFLAVNAAAVDVSMVMKICAAAELKCNQSAIETIFEEEAKKIGRSAEDHASICLKQQQNAELTPLERMLMNVELSRVVQEGTYRVKFNNSAEVMPYFKKHFSYTWKLFETRMEPMMKEQEKMSNEIRTYGENIQSLFLDAIVRVSQEEISTKEQLILAIFRELAKLVKAAIAGYAGLSDAAKTEMEKYSCVRTKYRALVETGAAAKYQAMMDAFAAQK
ncbi:hypothetical protein PFISCL1PPCAC_5122, partial [Pristionchus fissidentatus]